MLEPGAVVPTCGNRFRRNHRPGPPAARAGRTDPAGKFRGEPGLCGIDARSDRKPRAQDLMDEAKRLGRGTLYVIDRRTRAPEGPVREILEQDIFGEFDVRKGRIVPGSYRPNAKHCLLTEDGFFQLGPYLEQCLQEVIAAIPDPGDEAESLGRPN